MSAPHDAKPRPPEQLREAPDSKLVEALGAASLLPGFLLGLFIVIQGGSWHDATQCVVILIAFTIIGACVGFPAALCGALLHYFYQKRGWRGGWLYTLSGTTVGTGYGLLWGHAMAVFCGICGSLAALAAWLIVRRDRAAPRVQEVQDKVN